MGPIKTVLDWLDARSGWRRGRSRLLDEPIPRGVGWWFVSGSVVLMLLVVQFVTGVALATFYVPSPDAAYDSIRFLSEQVAFGGVLRALHYFGASFVVVAAAIHTARVVAFGSYKRPRELTWVTGVVLLLVIFGFALSGYLLPWDQKAYWATTVTINIARTGPFGEFVAGVLTGGSTLGALTLVRWYAAHVFLLPAALITLVVAHLFLMRRHGISGPAVPVDGSPQPFYPHHLLKDTLAGAAVFAALLACAVGFRAPLDAVADPTDASYVPRPEWYFLGLFQLLKYFSGPLEPLATVVIPAVIVAGLLLLPFLDRGPERRLRARPAVALACAALTVAVATLTILGYRSSPATPDPFDWGALPIAGETFIRDPRCESCHASGGAAGPVAVLRLRKEPEWLLAHVRDPEIIGPGLRQPPPGGMSEGQASAILSYLRKVRQGIDIPDVSDRARTASVVIGRYCANCHSIDGEGATSGPDLTHVGATRDVGWLRRWISEPESIDPFASMPAFGGALTAEEMSAVVGYLGGRR